MNHRIGFVEEVLGFLFEEGFARKFEQLGSPPNDLEFWYRNAKVFQAITGESSIANDQRVRLVTLIEAIRFDATCGALPGEPIEFDVSAYDLSADLLAHKQKIIDLVLRQEEESPSSIDPLPPVEVLVHLGLPNCLRRKMAPNPSIERDAELALKK